MAEETTEIETPQRDTGGMFIQGNTMGEQPSFTDAVKLEEDVQAYFKECEERKKPMTMAGLACKLRVHSKTLYNVRQRGGGIAEPLLQAMRIIERNHVEDLCTRTSQVAGPIFILKNAHGYADKQEIDITTRTEDLTDKELDDALAVYEETEQLKLLEEGA